MSESIVGKKFVIFDELGIEPSVEVVFCDTPAARWIDAIYAASESHGLSYEEASALTWFWMAYATAAKAGLKLSVPSLFRKGFALLVKRGWMVKRGRSITLTHNEITDTIYRSAQEAALLHMGSPWATQ